MRRACRCEAEELVGGDVEHAGQRRQHRGVNGRFAGLVVGDGGLMDAELGSQLACDIPCRLRNSRMRSPIAFSSTEAV